MSTSPVCSTTSVLRCQILLNSLTDYFFFFQNLLIDYLRLETCFRAFFVRGVVTALLPCGRRTLPIQGEALETREMEKYDYSISFHAIY